MAVDIVSPRVTIPCILNKSRIPEAKFDWSRDLSLCDNEMWDGVQSSGSSETEDRKCSPQSFVSFSAKYYPTKNEWA